MTDYPPDTLAGMAAWLARHMDRMRRHEAAAEAVSEITDAVRQAQRAIDRPPGRVYAGPCAECRLDLFAQPGQLRVICAGCGSDYSIGDRREWMRAAAQDMLGTPSWCALAATALGHSEVTSGVVRMWIHRKKLAVRPGNLCRVGDVMELMARRDAGRAR